MKEGICLSTQVLQHTLLVAKQSQHRLEAGRRTMSVNDMSRIDAVPQKSQSLLASVTSETFPDFADEHHCEDDAQEDDLFEINAESTLTPLSKHTYEHTFRCRYNFLTGLKMQAELLRQGK